VSENRLLDQTKTVVIFTVAECAGFKQWCYNCISSSQRSVYCSIQCCGSGMFIPDPYFLPKTLSLCSFQSCLRLSIFKIQSQKKHLAHRIRIKISKRGRNWIIKYLEKVWSSIKHLIFLLWLLDKISFIYLICPWVGGTQIDTVCFFPRAELRFFYFLWRCRYRSIVLLHQIFIGVCRNYANFSWCQFFLMPILRQYYANSK
jgi:hypothetical protein